LLALGRQQLEAQKSTAHAIARSNIAAADIIANEISEQTAALEASLLEYSDRVASSVSDAADQTSAAIEVLGDRLCGYLGEIKWQLAQQGEALTGILRALRASRSNEARQFVEQGLIAIQQGFSGNALEFFKDALRLPSALDRPSRNRALLTIARLYYAEGKYQDALVSARQASTLAEASQIDEIFMLGTYAALAGEVNECLQHLEQAIRMKPALFSKAAIDPNLEASKSSVLLLLSRLALEARDKGNIDVSTAQSLLARADQHADSPVALGERALARETLEAITRAAPRASYDSLLRLRKETADVTRAVACISDALLSAANQRAVQQAIPALTDAVTIAEGELERLQKLSPFRIRLWLIWHLGTVLSGGLIWVNSPGHDVKSPIELFLTVWFWAGFPLWMLAQYVSDKRATFVEAALGQDRTAQSQTVSVARSALKKADADSHAHQERFKSLLAEAKSLLEASKSSVLCTG
jgi:hypothetical protein